VVATRRTTKRTGSAETVAVGYVRVSTNEQGDSGLGLDAQRAAIRVECERRGWRLSSIAQDIASGKSTNGRPALTEALEAVEDGRASVLVAAKLDRIDRIARSVLDFASLMQRAERHGWAVVALDANVDTTTAQGGLMVHVLSAFAEYERRLIGDRTRAALAQKRAQGARLGRPVTLPTAVRERIRRESDAGRSLNAIAATLTAEGVATARGGGRWYASTVKAVLASLDADAAV
jgi:DNA invertase Pin-like site-specific DNA recombinase